jgi:hypothetical protein
MVHVGIIGGARYGGLACSPALRRRNIQKKGAFSGAVAVPVSADCSDYSDALIIN